MKIAVYAIALNEEKFAKRFCESCKDADLIVVGDTGSKDKTRKILRENGAKVVSLNIKPWRFDMARNAVLASLPLNIDWCIILDIDEILEPGWREQLEQIDPKDYNRVFCHYVWSHHRAEFGKEPFYEPSDHNIAFNVDRIHSRTNWIWRHAAHETLYPYGEMIPKPAMLPDLIIHHWPDHTKSRGQYIDLLKIRWNESPDSGTAYYYGRELFYHNRFQEAIDILQVSYSASSWEDEKIWVALTIAGCYRGLGKEHERYQWLETASTANSSEEPVCKASAQFAFYYYEHEEWKLCNMFAKEAIGAIKDNRTHFDDKQHESLIAYDMAAISSYRLGDFDSAVEYGNKALELNPNDERLKVNMEWYEKAIGEKVAV